MSGEIMSAEHELTLFDASKIQLLIPENNSLYNPSDTIEPLEIGQVTELILANEEGACGGVDMAELILDQLISVRNQGAAITIHANHPPSKGADRAAFYEQSDVTFGMPIEDIPDGNVVYLFSAHGADPREVTKATDRGFKVVDTTCPLVGRVYRDIRKFEKNLGDDVQPTEAAIVYVATSYEPTHPEVKGTQGLVADTGINFTHVSSKEEAIELVKKTGSTAEDLGLAGLKKVLMTGMTTNNSDVTKEIADAFQEALNEAGYAPDFLEPYNERSVCATVKFRQDAVRTMVSEGMIETLIVVGALGSNNTKELVTTAVDAASKMPASEARLQRIVFANTHRDVPTLSGRVGIASGASTQQPNIDQIIQKLNVEPENVTGIGGSTKIGGPFKPMGGPDTLARRILAGDTSWL